MNVRVQQALDLEVDRGKLTPAERSELGVTESSLGAVLRAIPDQPLAPLGDLIRRRIESRQERPEPARRSARRPSGVVDWFWRPRAVSIAWRPAYALAASLLVGVLLAALALLPDRPGLPAGRVFTQFVLRAPDAKHVALAGDFTEWQPRYEMTQSQPGVWTVVVPLVPGVHTYSFVVDGDRWVPDPTAPGVEDGFGGVNSRRAVLLPDNGRT